MKKLIYLSILASGLLFGMKASAQLKVSGEVRPRTEMYNGTNSALSTEDTKASVATQQRSRLYFSYTSDNGVTLVFTPQYINWWGGSAQTNGGSMSVFEAYGAYKFSSAFTLKFGRQALSYGDQRFFGALGWAAPGRAFDAAVGKFSFGDVKVDLGVTYNQVGHTNNFASSVVDNHKSLQYLWLDAPISESASLKFMVANVFQGLADPYTTIGLMPTIKAGPVKFDVSGYYQFGTFSGSDISAYLVSLAGSFKAGSVPLTIGADIVSGDDESTTDKNEGWKQQFGTNHKFYGFMDFFYVGEQPSMGLNDIYVKSKFKLAEKVDLMAHGHVLMANQTFTDQVSETAETAEGYLGSELDLVFTFKVAPEFKINLGYSQLFASDSFELYKAGDAGTVNNWAWLQLTFAPTFLQSAE